MSGSVNWQMVFDFPCVKHVWLYFFFFFKGMSIKWFTGFTAVWRNSEISHNPFLKMWSVDAQGLRSAGVESAGVQYCRVHSRWQLVLLFLRGGGEKHCSEGGKSDYSASWGEGGKKKRPTQSKSPMEQKYWCGQNQRASSRSAVQPDWLRLNKIRTMSVWGHCKLEHVWFFVWNSERQSDSDSQIGRPKGKRLTVQANAQVDWQINRRPSSGTEEGESTWQPVGRRQGTQREIKTAGQRASFLFHISRIAGWKSY